MQIDRKIIFFPIIFFGIKARQFGNMPRLRIQTLGNLLYTQWLLPQNSFWKKLSVKNPSKTSFFNKMQVHITIFRIWTLGLCKTFYSENGAVSQQNVVNKLEAERVDLQFQFYKKNCNYTRWLKNCGQRYNQFFFSKSWGYFSETAESKRF